MSGVSEGAFCHPHRTQKWIMCDLLDDTAHWGESNAIFNLSDALTTTRHIEERKNVSLRLHVTSRRLAQQLVAKFYLFLHCTNKKDFLKIEVSVRHFWHKLSFVDVVVLFCRLLMFSRSIFASHTLVMMMAATDCDSSRRSFAQLRGTIKLSTRHCDDFSNFLSV